MSLLSNILSSKIRAEVFRMLFIDADTELHMREIERRSGFSIGTIQTELKKLHGLELVISRRDGNRLYYRANIDHPIFPDIRNIVLKTIGLTDAIKSAIAKDSLINIAFVYGSIAANNEKARSDVDLMVIGDIGLRNLTKKLSGVTEQIGREINPFILTKKELQKRIQDKDHFVFQMLNASKIFIVGTENEFKNLAG